jgi:hypothetical protein
MKALALLLALPLTAHAGSWFDFEAGIGVNRYHTQDGLWNQQGSPGSVDITSPTFSLGVTGPLVVRSNWGIDWHADYVNLGHAGASCQCAAIDANYDSNAHRVLRSGPTANFQGSGATQGVSLTVEPYYVYRGLRFGIEGGAFAYRAGWNEAVYGEGAPIHQSSSGIHPAAIIGASVSRGPWSIAYRHYIMIWNTGTPPLATGADTLEVKYKF